MAKKRKKKKSTPAARPLSPAAYVKKQAHKLPIYKILITKAWKEVGKANVLVVRQHKTGNITAGFFLVDLFCLGVKEVYYTFNISLRTFREDIEDKFPLEMYQEIPYHQAHAIIYGAAAYAGSLGLPSHRDFSIVKGILEPEDADVEPFEVVFGLNGRPYLDPMPGENLHQAIKILDRTVGRENYDLTLVFTEDGYDDDDDDEFDDPYGWDDEEWETFFKAGDIYSFEFRARALDALYHFYNDFVFDLDEWDREYDAFMFVGFDMVYSGDTDSPDNGLSRDQLMESIEILEAKNEQSIEEMLEWLHDQPINYWTRCYAIDKLTLAGRVEEARSLAEETFAKYPKIFIVKLTMARFKLAKGDVDWVATHLGNRFYPKDVAPERNLFAGIEITRLIALGIHYHTLLEDYDTASKYHDWLWNLPYQDGITQLGIAPLARYRASLFEEEQVERVP